MSEELFELDLSQLESVAGGRITKSVEQNAYLEMRQRVISRCEELKKQGREAESIALRSRFGDAFAKWKTAIFKAPLGSPEIPISDYFTLDEE